MFVVPLSLLIQFGITCTGDYAVTVYFIFFDEMTHRVSYNLFKTLSQVHKVIYINNIR